MKLKRVLKFSFLIVMIISFGLFNAQEVLGDGETCPAGISAGDSCVSWGGGCYCGSYDFYCGNYNGAGWKWFTTAPTCGSSTSCNLIDYTHGTCSWLDAQCWYKNDGSPTWEWTFTNEVDAETGTYPSTSMCNDGYDNDCDTYTDGADSGCCYGNLVQCSTDGDCCSGFMITGFSHYQKMIARRNLRQCCRRLTNGGIVYNNHGTGRSSCHVNLS